MFSTWEQGFETPPMECSPVECGQSDSATGALESLKVTGCWSRLDRRVRSVAAEDVHFGLMTECWVAQRPDAGRVCPVSADVCSCRAYRGDIV